MINITLDDNNRKTVDSHNIIEVLCFFFCHSIHFSFTVYISFGFLSLFLPFFRLNEILLVFHGVEERASARTIRLALMLIHLHRFFHSIGKHWTNYNRMQQHIYAAFLTHPNESFIFVQCSCPPTGFVRSVLFFCFKVSLALYSGILHRVMRTCEDSE